CRVVVFQCVLLDDRSVARTRHCSVVCSKCRRAPRLSIVHSKCDAPFAKPPVYGGDDDPAFGVGAISRSAHAGACRGGDPQSPSSRSKFAPHLAAADSAHRFDSSLFRTVVRLVYATRNSVEVTRGPLIICPHSVHANRTTTDGKAFGQPGAYSFETEEVNCGRRDTDGLF